MPADGARWHLDKPAAVYRAFNSDDILLYVGCSRRPEARIRQQRKLRRWWWHEVARTDTRWYDTRLLAEAAETEAICAEMPRYNLQFELAAGVIRPGFRLVAMLEPSDIMSVVHAESLPLNEVVRRGLERGPLAPGDGVPLRVVLSRIHRSYLYRGYMPGKRTSVYLSEEIDAALKASGRQLAEVIATGLGIEPEPREEVIRRVTRESIAAELDARRVGVNAAVAAVRAGRAPSWPSH